MGKREELFIAFGVILFLLLAAGLYWLCRVRSRRAVDSALEEIRLTGLVPGLQGIQFSADGVLGPAGATEPTWEGAVVVLDTSDAPLRGVYPDTPLWRVFRLVDKDVPQGTLEAFGRHSFLDGPQIRSSSGTTICTVTHVCPGDLHTPAQPGRAGVAKVKGALRQVAEKYACLCAMQLYGGRSTYEGLPVTVLMTVPFSEVNNGIMPKVEQARYFAGCLAVASSRYPGRRSHVPFKLCCDGEEMRRICTDAAYNAARGSAQCR
ncbi:hypothetical protein [Neorickettsia sennetsu]|uniref:Uncharacterized protein n=1 Tax=Ehrlichia sennetsu (strain ATCC VR-367 / Miyayama) TaxID=222891 RepID=Q2GET3_EHRS3|nr:hypothetical protein [Neorickettsia sennetsu]ABD46133.1 hypothetical protein NSE_0113 [Neorickettsia sennetsu str. Miyayama]